MLKPAILYKQELENKFAKEIYTEKYFYYIGYAYEFELPNIRVQDYYYQWAIVQTDDSGEKLVGYLTYHIDVSTDTVDRFGLYSFDDGNLTVIRDTYNILEKLVEMHRRIEWRVIEGNHAKHGYDAFCARHNGKSVCLHNVTKDLEGNYRDEYIYEVVRKR